MPAKLKKKNKNKNTNKNGFRIGGVNTVTSVAKTFPERLQVALGYVTSGVHSGAVAVDYVWNPNGLFDPDFTAAGHQPLGYDQWTAMYNRYLVHNCHVRVTIVHLNATQGACIVGITAINGQQAALNATQMTQAVEGMRCKWSIVGPNGNSARPTILTMKIPLARMAGATRERYLADDRYQALVSANPSELIGLHLFAYDATFATNVSVGWQLDLCYEAEFFDRNFPGQSTFLTRTEEEMKKIHPPQFLQCLKGIKTGDDASLPGFKYAPLPYDRKPLGITTSSSDKIGNKGWDAHFDDYSVDDLEDNYVKKEEDISDFEDFRNFMLAKQRAKKSSSSTSSQSGKGSSQ